MKGVGGKGWSIAAITAGALVVYGGLRQLGGAADGLSHRDFQRASTFAPEYCDAGTAAFVPREAMRGAVDLMAAVEPASKPGEPDRLILRLASATGRPIGPAALVETHTRLLHLLVVDPALSVYLHLHPEPTARVGEWEVPWSPPAADRLRLFAEFTPRATGRGLYGWTDLEVGAQADRPGSRHADQAAATQVDFSWPAGPPRVHRGARVRVRVAAAADAPLEPVMGAWAHLVIFDRSADGFAHLHPVGGAADRRTDGPAPEERRQTLDLEFEGRFPRPGAHRGWLQVRAGGRDEFAPLDVDVLPAEEPRSKRNESRG